MSTSLVPSEFDKSKYHKWGSDVDGATVEWLPESQMLRFTCTEIESGRESEGEWQERQDRRAESMSHE